MLTLKQRIEYVEGGLKINDNNQDALDSLSAIEAEITTYTRLGTPAWKAQDAREQIKRIRDWICAESKSIER